MKKLTHISAQGQAHMVDIGCKPPMQRTAIAQGQLTASPATIALIMAGDLPKGDALSVARIAGIAAAKRCDELIPLCHTLPLDHVQVDFHKVGEDRIAVTATASLVGKTGVEMEALLAVSMACLTLYDMTKAVDKAMCIQNIHLVEKHKSPCV